jgi:hypothetical protein
VFVRQRAQIQALLWRCAAGIDPRGLSRGDMAVDDRIGLDPHGDNLLDVAMESAALELTRMLMPALRSDPGAHRATPSAPRSPAGRALSATTTLLAR